MVIFPKFTASEYLFNKDLAAHIVYAEVKHFAARESIHGRTEDEVRTLTRKLSWQIDADLHWSDVEELIDQVRNLPSIEAGTHYAVELNEARTVDNRTLVTERLMAYLGHTIDLMLGTIKARYEVAA